MLPGGPHNNKNHRPTYIILHYYEKCVHVNKYVYQKKYTYLCKGSVLIYIFESDAFTDV